MLNGLRHFIVVFHKAAERTEPTEDARKTSLTTTELHHQCGCLSIAFRFNLNLFNLIANAMLSE